MWPRLRQFPGAITDLFLNGFVFSNDRIIGIQNNEIGRFWRRSSYSPRWFDQKKQNSKTFCASLRVKSKAVLRRGAGAVEQAGLENRSGGNSTVGSNPTLSVPDSFVLSSLATISKK